MAAQMTQESFLSRAREVWGDRWNYSETKYVKARDPITIICKTHNLSFTQQARKHLAKQVGCPACGGRAVTTEGFVLKAKEVWGDRWDYTPTQYAKATVPVQIACPEHGEFTQLPNNHLSGRVGCPSCHGKVLTEEQFFAKAHEVWGDRWDYSDTKLVGSPHKMSFRCSLHGEFTQTSAEHLGGKLACGGCINQEELETFLTEAKAVWGDRWDYSNLTWDAFTPGNLSLICRDHGEFTQSRASHLKSVVSCQPCVKAPRINIRERIRDTWGDRWDYSLVDFSAPYESYSTIICPEHGEFTQTLYAHSQGRMGCVACRKAESGAGRKAQAVEVWGDRWGYSSSDFTTSAEGHITVTCPTHGDFTQKLRSHLNGVVGCKACRRPEKPPKPLKVKRVPEPKPTPPTPLERFLRRAEAIWGDRWDYSQTELTSMRDLISIRCKEHDLTFTQRVGGHLKGQVGCKTCHREALSERKKGRKSPKLMPLDRFLAKAEGVWGDRWDYSKTQYKGIDTLATFICPTHGEFQQSPYSHLKGMVGCNGCGGGGSLSQVGFLERAYDVWGDRWDYSTTKIQGLKRRIEIGCLQHNKIFSQIAFDHLDGKVGCTSCQHTGTSKGEKELISFVEDITQGDTVLRNARNHLGSGWELDVYVPAANSAFEFNGVYYHSEAFKDSSYHYDKWKMADEAGIKLIQVWEDDWLHRPDIVKSHIRQVLGKSPLPKVPARKTKIQNIRYAQAKQFLDTYHIQGGASGSVYLGAFYEGDLVAVAVFKSRLGDYELVRYATSANVQGGHSKFISYFEKNYTYGELITFADLTFGNGNLYEVTGWTRDKILDPDYSYLVRGRREHKFGYRLKRFREDPNLKYIEGMTERELAQLNGLHRVYDAGKIRYVKPHPDTVPPILD